MVWNKYDLNFLMDFVGIFLSRSLKSFAAWKGFKSAILLILASQIYLGVSTFEMFLPTYFIVTIYMYFGTKGGLVFVLSVWITVSF